MNLMIQRHKEDVDLINVTTMLIVMKGMMMMIMMVAMTGGDDGRSCIVSERTIR